jgi:hypothetical protein
MSLEQLVVLAIFVLVPLANALLRWLRRRLEPPAPPAPAAPPPPPPVRVEPGPAWLPTSLPPAARATVARPEEWRAPRQARARRHAWSLGPAGARRGIVLMTVLGPCAAQDPAGSPGRRVDERPSG